MTKYTFYVEGLGREFDSVASTQKEASANLWASMSDAEQNAVVQFECVDESPA